MNVMCIGHEAWYRPEGGGYPECQAVRSWFARVVDGEMVYHASYTSENFGLDADIQARLGEVNERYPVGKSGPMNNPPVRGLWRPEEDVIARQGEVVGYFVGFRQTERVGGKTFVNQLQPYLALRHVEDDGVVRTIHARVGRPDERDIMEGLTVTQGITLSYHKLMEMYPPGERLWARAEHGRFWWLGDTPESINALVATLTPPPPLKVAAPPPLARDMEDLLRHFHQGDHRPEKR